MNKLIIHPGLSLFLRRNNALDFFIEGTTNYLRHNSDARREVLSMCAAGHPSTITFSMDWSGTPQGHTFWSNLHREFTIHNKFYLAYSNLITIKLV